MRKSFDELNAEYKTKDIDQYNAIFNKWSNAAWEIENVYMLYSWEEMSNSKARELVRAIIEKHSKNVIDKERIDYEIAAKKAAKDKETKEWGCSGIIAIFFFLSLLIIFKTCTQ